LTGARPKEELSDVMRGPPAWRSFAWRVGIGAPRSARVRAHVGRVAVDLDAAATSAEAARALGLPGLYRSPACWGGDAPVPAEATASFGPKEWAARCQAASFEIAVALGVPALPFVIEHAFGPFGVLHGVALRALFRLEAATRAVPTEILEAAVEQLADLEAGDREAAVDGLVRDGSTPSPRRLLLDALERVVQRAKSVKARLSALDPLARLAPDRAKRFLPDLRRLLAKDDEHALDAALLVRELEPRDSEAKDVLRRLADSHPDPEVRTALEARLRPPRPIPGGSA
jgi:hypothetical protein